MNRSFAVVIVLAGLVGGIAATYAAVADTPPENLTCAGERVVVFGWTSRQVSMAELAAIAKWQHIVKTKFPGFDQWHQAYKRSLNCRLFGGSNHYQCQVAATPCRFKDSSSQVGKAPTFT